MSTQKHAHDVYVNFIIAKTWKQLRCPSVQFSSVTQLCPTLGDLMDCNMPGFPVHH